MDLLENPKLQQMLKHLNNSDFKKFNTFMWNGSHITSVIRYVQKLPPTDENSYVDLLDRLDASRNTSRYPRMVLSFINKLTEFFRLPKREFTSNFRANEVLASFFDFLLDTVEEIVKCHADLVDPIEGEVEILQENLKFLITILGDAPFRCTENTGIDETKNLLQGMEAIANELADFLYLFFFTDEGRVTRMNIPLSKLLKKMDLMEAKIKAHCISKVTVSRNTTVDSLFIVDSLLSDLEDLLNLPDHDDLIVNVCNEIRILKEEIMTISRSILKGVKEQQQHLELARRIKEMAYEAEYVISSYVVGDIPVWYVKVRLSNIIQRVNLSSIGFEEFKKKNDGANKYSTSSLMVGDIPVWYLTPRFRDMVGNTLEPRNMKSQKLAPIGGGEVFIGFKDDASKITDQLVGQEKFQIIFITGMGGLGKSTLAKKLYDDPTISSRFDRRAFCVASQTYRKKDLLMDILSSVSDLGQDKLLSMDAERLGKELHQCLMWRRYLIVVDDVWKENVLEDIGIYLPKNGNGSRIMITSRNKDIAPTGTFVHSLPFLSDKDCWELLHMKVFPKDNCPQELEEAGKKIVELCQGLPLAVVVIAAVLKNTEKKKTLWNEVIQSLNLEIAKDPHKCMNILEFSYNNLPAHLKPCFLYFGAFPEYREISVHKLISLWIAEGFVRKEENKSLEALAEEYLMELINRSLVLVSKRRSGDGVKSCTTHDLLRYLCVKKSEDDNFLNSIKDQFSLYDRHQRLKIPSESINVESIPFGLHLRTLLVAWPDITSLSYSRLKHLRILHFSTKENHKNSQVKEDLDLTGIEQLVYMRYLEIKLSSEIIPKSVCSLQNLKFLYFHGTGYVLIPERVKNLMKLRHFHVKPHAKFDESFHSGAIQLNFLESLSSLLIVNENDEKALKCFPQLKRLRCATKLVYDSSEKQYRYLLLDCLSKLESLNISYMGSELKFSGRIRFPSTLKKLTLHKFKLSWKDMSMIGNLPKLEVLKLAYIVFEGKEWKTNDKEYTELRYLKLDTLRLQRWTTKSDHFPNLQRLVLQKCWKMKKFPSDLGESPTLETINIESCSKSMADSALVIQENQHDMGNDFKVIISETCW